jgi:hypothetical protein
MATSAEQLGETAMETVSELTHAAEESMEEATKPVSRRKTAASKG